MTGRTALAATLLLALAGCGGVDPAPEPSGAPSASPSAEDAVARCLPTIGADEPARAEVLEPDDAARLPAVVWGEGGGTVLVLLHQTNRDGLCGWTPFGRHVAAEGLGAVAFDMCGWASAECEASWDDRPSDEVAYAVQWAREELGAQRVVLVGASMGGARAVFAVADGVAVDGWVDVSGASAWDGREKVAEAARIDVPGLVLHDPTDGDQAYVDSRREARAAGAEFVRARGGHGYDVLVSFTGRLTRYGRQVLAFAAGEGA